jgi:predicted nucleotidyltransferase
MRLTEKQKEQLRKELVSCLSSDTEIVKIVIFGSFSDSDDPNDIDVAVFQDSKESYLPLAMKYRKRTRAVSDRIPLDIFPVKAGACSDPFLSEIIRGEVIYER